jgi:hypothetical protein
MKQSKAKKCACGEIFEQEQCPCCADREAISLDDYIKEIAEICENKLKNNACELEKQRIETKLEVDNLLHYVEHPEYIDMMDRAKVIKTKLRTIQFMLRERE